MTAAIDKGVAPGREASFRRYAEAWRPKTAVWTLLAAAVQVAKAPCSMMFLFRNVLKCWLLTNNCVPVTGSLDKTWRSKEKHYQQKRWTRARKHSQNIRPEGCAWTFTSDRNANLRVSQHGSTSIMVNNQNSCILINLSQQQQLRGFASMWICTTKGWHSMEWWKAIEGAAASITPVFKVSRSAWKFSKVVAAGSLAWRMDAPGENMWKLQAWTCCVSWCPSFFQTYIYI